MGFRLWRNIFSTVLWKKNCVLDFSHVRNSIHNTLSGVSMYCLIHHQGSRCINEYIVRGGVVLENVSSPLRFITKYIHFCLFNKVNVIQNILGLGLRDDFCFLMNKLGIYNKISFRADRFRNLWVTCSNRFDKVVC